MGTLVSVSEAQKFPLIMKLLVVAALLVVAVSAAPKKDHPGHLPSYYWKDGGDLDGDGIPNYLDPDVDGDGTADPLKGRVGYPYYYGYPYYRYGYRGYYRYPFRYYHDGKW